MAVPDQLAALLQTWRRRADPKETGLATARGSRKTPGLRREEVAWLAGVSVDYVKRLEQGRAHPSGAVLRSLSRALRLSDAEYELACRLGGYTAACRTLVPQHIGPSAQRLLDRLSESPIAVFDAAWTLLDANPLWAELVDYGPGRGGRTANLVWRLFTGQPSRVQTPDPEQYRSSLVADLRDVAAKYPADRQLASMIATLRTEPTFADLWDRSDVSRHGGEPKTVTHPDLGEIELDCDVLTVHGEDLRVVVFSAPPGSEAAGRLRILADRLAPTTER